MLGALAWDPAMRLHSCSWAPRPPALSPPACGAASHTGAALLLLAGTCIIQCWPTLGGLLSATIHLA
jgi:hypothetical protein